jgi:protein-tyrosine phosphatase
MSWIDLEGAANVRDVGGLPTVDGRATRPGVLLRADNLQGLTASDVQRLTGDLGVRTVLDLRTGREVEEEGPGPLRATDVVHHHVSLIPEPPGEPKEQEIDRAVPHRPDRAGATPTDMTGYYVGYLEDAPQGLAQALRLLADPTTGPALVHCAAGKDRTGVVVAVALSLAGVRREAVVADYARSAERIDGVLRRLQGTRTYGPSLADTSADAIRPVASSMERFLDHVDRAYGGPHGLAMAVGVPEETVARLATRLVGTSPHARQGPAA